MLALLAVAIVVLYVVWYYVQVAKYPKGPTPLPLVGNILQLPRENIHLYIREVKKKYGPVFTIFTPLPVVVLSDYESLKEALVTKGEHFIGRVMRPPTSFFSNVPGGGGILANDGDSWRDQRRIALSILRDFGMGRNMMEQKIMHSVAEMCDSIDKTEDKSRVNMYPTLQLCVGNVINELLFGYIYHHENTEKFLGFCGIINEFFQCFHRPDMLLVEAWSWTKHLPLVRGPYNKTLRDMTAYFDFIIKEVEAQEKTFDPSAPPTSFVHAYMKEIDGNNNVQKSYCREQLIVLASDFWAAGMETTATSLRWAVMFMMRWPDIQMKVQAEIDRVIGCDRFPTLTDKPNLPYTNAVILEVQRYANIVSAPGSHRTTSDQTVKGLTIPSDTAVQCQFFSVLKDDPIFEKSEEFRPERFLNDDGVTFRKDLNERMVQFGMGKRNCAGESLARMELFLIFATLMQRYRFVANGPVDLTPIYGLVLTPKDHHGRVQPRV